MVRPGLLACLSFLAAAPAAQAQIEPGVTPPGAYWVRRIAAHGASMCGPNGCSRTGRTSCAASTVTDRSIEIEVAPGFATRSVLRLAIRRTAAGWDATVPALTVIEPGRPRRIELDGSCLAHLPLTFGDLFPDRPACEAAPDTFRATCAGPGCARAAGIGDDGLGDGTWSFDPPAARPLLLPGCESTFAALAARAALVTHAEYADIARTHRAFVRLAAAGGSLHESHESGCATVTLRRAATGESDFVTRWRETDGTRVRARARYRLEPLLGAAMLLAYSDERINGSARGGTGFGGPRPVGLHFGAGVILLGDRTLYLRRRDCAR